MVDQAVHVKSVMSCISDTSMTGNRALWLVYGRVLGCLYRYGDGKTLFDTITALQSILTTKNDSILKLYFELCDD